MFVAIDAVGIRGHGGAAVLNELLFWLPKVRPKWRWHVFLFDKRFREFENPVFPSQIIPEYINYANSPMERVHWFNYILQKRIKIISPDIILGLANLGSSRPLIPQVVFVHQPNAFKDIKLSFESCQQFLHFRFLRHFIIQGAKASRIVIVQTEAMMELLKKLEPSLTGKIEIVPSGFRTISSNLNIRYDIKKMIDEIEPPKLIYVTHPGVQKNHISLIRALPSVINVFPNVCLFLTLDIERKQDPTYSKYIRQILEVSQQLKVLNNIRWLGVLNHEEVAYALSHSDLLVFPSLSESFGLGLVESMAAGCPIAAADLPYAHDVAKDAALYFDPHNPISIAECVINFLKSDNIRKDLILKAHNIVGLYSYEKIAEKIAQILERAKYNKY